MRKPPKKLSKKKKSAVSRYIWKLLNRTTKSTAQDIDEESKAKYDGMFTDRRNVAESTDRRQEEASIETPKNERRFDKSRRNLRKKFLDNWYLSSAMDIEEVEVNEEDAEKLFKDHFNEKD